MLLQKLCYQNGWYFTEIISKRLKSYSQLELNRQSGKSVALQIAEMTDTIFCFYAFVLVIQLEVWRNVKSKAMIEFSSINISTCF